MKIIALVLRDIVFPREGTRFIMGCATVTGRPAILRNERSVLVIQPEIDALDRVAKSALFGTDIADYWFPVSTGGDIAFLYGVLKILIEKNQVDHNFIANHAVGFDELKTQISILKYENMIL